MRYALTLLGALTALVGVLLFPPQKPGEVAVDFVEDAGVTIVWTSDERNCGAQLGTGAGGCFWPDLPGTVFVSPGMDESVTEYIVYHEYAHALGIMDECDADAYAIEKGVDPAIVYYTANC